MTFEYEGYDLKFVQKKTCKDPTAHQFSLIYKFFSPKTKLVYVLSAEYHSEDIFSIKFYPKCYKHSDFKYNRIINKGDLGNILVTCAKVVPILLSEYPTASFGFIGSQTVEKRTQKTEPLDSNQRFRIYKHLTSVLFGTKTFEHFEYPSISGYLLINRINIPITNKERAIVKMFLSTYQTSIDLVL